MSSNDTSVDVLRRGARILGGIAGVEALAPSVIEARAPPVLLTAIESHRGSRDVVFLAFSVLTLLRGPAVCTAIRELAAVETVASLFRAAVAARDVEFYAVLLELMLSLTAESDLADALAARAGAPLVALAAEMAAGGAAVSGDADTVTLLS
jgi:hypothetical protein